MTDDSLAARFASGEPLTAKERRKIQAVLDDRESWEQAKADRLKLINTQRLYWYTAYIPPNKPPFDADSTYVLLDKGYGDVDRKPEPIRSLGINANEVRSGSARHRKKGREARDYARHILTGKTVLIRSHLDRHGRPRVGKYRRYLAEIFAPDPETGELFNLNERLVSMGLAREQWYSDEPQPWSEL